MPQLTKDQIAEILESIAQMLELKGELVFKVRAYSNAARALESFSGDLAKAVTEAQLSEIPGIGKAIALRVVDEYHGGTLSIRRGRKYPGPPSLGELTKFFLSRWNLLDVLRRNFAEEGYPSEKVLRFFWASSDFYPGFDDLLRYRVRNWLTQLSARVELQDEAHL